MSDYCIRLYKDSDYHVVMALFSRGIKEHTPGAFYHLFHLIHFWITAILVFLLTFLTMGSITVSLLAVTLLIVILYICVRHIYHSYLKNCLSDDMLDISKYYLQRDGYCFWVAECAGQVVGTVAVVPPADPREKKHVELKRLSVALSHRGKGIAKALCRAVIDFARDRGCEAVVLQTSLAQSDAQRLYEKMGFRLMRIYLTNMFTKFIDFRILLYQYNLPRSK
ncbi:N-acetyltransferase 8-like [Bombina bombina]|uniref:N-acetyltransferase 8-like n=1 Tax=Bombina bombina TaxID=8345 RepID=UPI00235A5BCC|nr:N-acetyltransferase 8-like [Bombina bombina]